MHMDIAYADQLLSKIVQNKDYEVVLDYQEANLVIVYTCAFGPHQKESMEILADVVVNAKQSARIIATGCLVKLKKEELSKIPSIEVMSWKEVKGLFYTAREVKTSMNLQNVVIISEGCNHHCAYCVYPQFMNQYKSKPMEEVLEEVGKLYETEDTIYITGALETSSYGMDLYGKRSFPELLERIVTRYPNCNYVIGWFHPIGLTRKMIALLAEYTNITSIMVHIQHVDNEILKAMNRPTFEFTNERIEMLKFVRPDIQICTEVIVGYPGETYEKFKMLYEYLKKGYFSDIGVATFEPVPGTKASKLESQVPNEEKKKRMELISKLFSATCYPESENPEVFLSSYFEKAEEAIRQMPKHILTKTNEHHLIAKPDTKAKLAGFSDILDEVYSLIVEARTPYDYQQNKKKLWQDYTSEARELFCQMIEASDTKAKIIERAKEMLL